MTKCDCMEIKHVEGKFYTETQHGDAFLLYKTEGKIISIYETFTPEEERGKGIAEHLATAAFKFAKENSLKVKPDCPYIQHFASKHKELAKYICAPYGKSGSGSDFDACRIDNAHK